MELGQMGGGGGSGGTLAFETPIGAIDDSNVTFTVVHDPLFIIVNGAAYTAGTGTFAAYVAPTITLTAPVGVGGFILSAYT